MTSSGAHREWVVFEPADPPRTGRLVFGDPAGTAALTVVMPQGDSFRRGTVPARRVAVGDAIPALLDAGATPAARFWAAAVRQALHLVARGRILPGVSENGYDAWRIGPLDSADLDRLADLAAAIPPEARAAPLPGDELRLPAGGPLLRRFLDAVADTLPRTPVASQAAGGPLFAAVQPQPASHLRRWSEEIAAGVDAQVRISLRLEGPGDDGIVAAVLQVHGLAEPAPRPRCRSHRRRPTGLW